MNYQLLIESYYHGTKPTELEISLLELELYTQISNIKISKNFECLSFAPEHICSCLNLKKNSFWITCLAEIIDKYKKSEIGITKGAEVYQALFREGLVVG